MTTRRFLQLTGLSAIVAGLLFIIIQPLHPSDTLGSVTTETWAVVHYLTLVMSTLFVFGLTGIYLRQIEETGWLGFVGYTTLSIGVVVTGAFVFVEAFVSPLLVNAEPAFVQGMLALVEGKEIQTDLGVLPGLYSLSSILFPLGCLVFGVASWRARVLPRLASAILAFGLPIAVIVFTVLPFGMQRLGAVPVGAGLAWMGYAVLTERVDEPAAVRAAARSFRPVA